MTVADFPEIPDDVADTIAALMDGPTNAARTPDAAA